MVRPRVAFVVQRYGLEVNGGSEQLCRSLAERLAPHIDLDVLTTCALDHSTWENYYPPGQDEINGIKVRRFIVEEGRASDFDRLIQSFYGRPHSPEEELLWLRKQGPHCPGLLEFIKAEGQGYDLFLFFTYLYSPTFHGLPLVAERSILVPTVHDEPAVRLGIFRRLFRMPRYIVYLTPWEQRFVQELFRNAEVPSQVIGAGLGQPPEADPERFRCRHGLEGDFLLYLGRIEGAKGCHQMIDYFLRFRAEAGRPLKLVLCGRAQSPLPTHPDIIPLGFVTEEEKFDALAAATLLLSPSPYESLSLTCLEAWQMALPVLGNGECGVLVEHCLAGNGGLFYRSYPEFALCLRLLLDNPQLRHGLGAKGQRYVVENYSWDGVKAKYLRLLRDLS